MFQDFCSGTVIVPKEMYRNSHRNPHLACDPAPNPQGLFDTDLDGGGKISYKVGWPLALTCPWHNSRRMTDCIHSSQHNRAYPRVYIQHHQTPSHHHLRWLPPSKTVRACVQVERHHSMDDDADEVCLLNEPTRSTHPRTFSFFLVQTYIYIL